MRRHLPSGTHPSHPLTRKRDRRLQGLSFVGKLGPIRECEIDPSLTLRVAMSNREPAE